MRKIKYGYDEFILTLKILLSVALVGLLAYNFIVKPIICERSFPKKVIEKIDLDALYENRHMLEQAGMGPSDNEKWFTFLDLGGYVYIYNIRDTIYDYDEIVLDKKIPNSDVTYEYNWMGLDDPPDVVIKNDKILICVSFGSFDGNERTRELIEILKKVGAYKE